MIEPVSLTEIASRAAALQRALAEHNLDLALVHQGADLFYYTGTLVDGFLALSPRSVPCSWCAGPRAGRVGPARLSPQIFYKDIKELPAILERAGLKPKGAIGRNWTSCPPCCIKGCRRNLPAAAHLDVSPLIRRQRMSKPL